MIIAKLDNFTHIYGFACTADKRTKRNFQLSGQIWKDSIWPNHSGHVSYHKAGKTWLDKYIYPLAFDEMCGRMMGRYSIHSQWTRILFLLSGGRWEVISTKIGNPLNLINLRNINIQIPQHFILYFIVKVGRNGRNGLFVRISPFHHVLQHIWGRTEASPVVGII